MTAYYQLTDELHRLLHSLDDELEAYDMPDFDYDDLSQRIDAVKLCLEKVHGHKLKRDNTQDAFFISDLEHYEEYEDNGEKKLGGVYVVRFSLFGNLTTVWTTYPNLNISEQLEKDTVKCLEQYGFTYINAGVLTNSKYDGKHKYFLENNLTWWDRFFEYE